MQVGLAWAATLLAGCPPQLPGPQSRWRPPRGGPRWVPAHTTGPTTPGALLRSSELAGRAGSGSKVPSTQPHCPPLALTKDMSPGRSEHFY